MTTYKINYKNARKNFTLPIIFLLIGIVFIVIISVIGINFKNKDNKLDAQINAQNIEWVEDRDDDGITYKPVYYYEIDGLEYTCSSNVSSNSKNAKGIVYFNTNNPSECLTDYEKSNSKIFLVFMILPIVFIIIGGVILIKNIKKIRVMKQLATNGILVKGIPYELVYTNITVNNNRLQAISINYKFPNGEVRTLKGLPLYKGSMHNYDSGLCDLLYDPSNYDNYYIDFEINLTGVGTPIVEHYKIDESTFK